MVLLKYYNMRVKKQCKEQFYAKHYEDGTCIHIIPDFESPTKRNNKSFKYWLKETILPKISRDFANFKNYEAPFKRIL